MRILSIRGENLASLAGSFEVDLTAAPLVTAGIFAITGPTGAGKSTLLDALCVALFDRTPRLSDQGGVELGGAHDRLKAHDVRSLLRKGTSHGAASVDFSGIDSLEYTATWRVDRSKRTGKLNEQVMTLHERGDETKLIAGGKTRKRDALAEIEKRLGLSFDEFRQAALLAQGDFAAFLRADQRHRASLLERITGTRIYTHLSKLAHERARDERQKLEHLSRDLLGISVLGATEREALENQERALQEEEKNATRELQTLDVWTAWFRALETLTGSEADAAAERLEKEAAWDALAPVQNEIARHAKLGALLPLIERFDRCEQALSTAQTTLIEATRHHEIASQRLEQTQVAHTIAESNERTVESRVSGAQEELQRAATLDGELTAARRQRHEGGVASARARSEAEAETKLANDRKADLEAARAEQKKDKDWLEERVVRRELALRWDRWSERIDTFVELAAARAKLDAAGAQARVIEGETRTKETDEARDQSQRALLLAQALVDEAERRVSSAEQTLAPDLRDDLLRRDGLLRDLEEARQLAQKATHDRANVMAEKRRTEREVLRADETTLQARASLKQAQISLEEAEKERDQWQRKHELLAVRASLQSGDACPVCGATDHPDTTSGDEVTSIRSDHVKRAITLRRELIDIERSVARAEAEYDERKKRVKDRENDANRYTFDLESATSTYDEKLAALESKDLPGQPTDEGAAELIAARRSVVTADLEALQEREREAATARKEAAIARADRDRARGIAEATRISHEEAQRGLEVARRDASTLEVEHQRLTSAIAVESEALDPVLSWIPSWETMLAKQRSKFRRTCEERVNDYLAHAAALDASTTKITKLEPEESAARARAAARVEGATRAAEAEALVIASLEAIESERQRLLSGRTTAEVRHELDEATRVAREQSRKTRIALDEASASMQQASGALERAGASETIATEALSSARITLDTSLNNEDEHEVRALLNTPTADIELKKKQLETASKHRDDARVIEGERRARREQHESSERPPLSSDELRTRRTEHVVRLDETRETSRHASLRRGIDDEARERRGSLQQRLDAQQIVVDLWGALDGLIGSSDGSKFTKFAQGLTLHALVHHANEHLADFARRYQLAPVPGTDLELQIVDREMGDEIRAVGSLSGGETFLVSLSLALALSTLGSRGTQVGTLFIDEGFGTLDLATLDTAIDALGALQSEGRQIGLISHIPGLAERLGIRVEVAPRGGGRSVVRVISEG